MRGAVLLALAGCGRLGFSSSSDAAADVVADADVNGIVGWWAMESIAGDMTADSSGHGHPGVCSSAAMSCPVIVAGKHGNGLRFDGVNDHLDIADAPDLETTIAFTVAAWLWIDALPTGSNYYCFANKFIGTQTGNSWQVCVTQSGALYFGTAYNAVNGDDLYTNNILVTTAAWHHIAVRWDGTFKTIWFDGVNETGQPASITFDGSPIVLGYDIDNSAPVAPLAGILDDVRIYNRALSDAEIVPLSAP